MPNHVHGVLLLPGDPADTACRVPTTETFRKPLVGSLPTIIRSFKGAVTREINSRARPQRVHVWQPRYFEHVVRNEASLRRIREYIATNPLRWYLDKENPKRSGVDDFDAWLEAFRHPPPNTRPEPPER